METARAVWYDADTDDAAEDKGLDESASEAEMFAPLNSSKRATMTRECRLSYQYKYVSNRN